MERRDFLKKAAVTAATVAAAESDGQAASNNGKLPRREYGKTGEKLSIIGFGGIVVMGSDQAYADRVVAEAIERGVNYFDVAPTYGNGEAETKLGPALEPYRKNCFLACKTTRRDRPGAEAELKQSLERLRTDHFDLYQLHAITDVEKDVDAVFKKGGAMEVFIQAKKEGRVRHLGFSAHSVEAAFAAMDRYDFDSVLFPFNFATWYKEDFGPQVIERAKAKGVARLALKAMARQSWPDGAKAKSPFKKCWYQPLNDPEEQELGLRFTLSQPITAAIPPGEEKLFRRAVDLAMDLKPITADEEKRLAKLATGLNPIFKSA